MAKKSPPKKLFFLLPYFFFATTFANPHSPQQSKKDPVIEHIRNAHVWHFATIGETHYTLHLPIVIYKKGEGLYLFSSKRFWKGHDPTTHQGFQLDTSTETITTLDGTPIYDLSLTRDLCNIFISLFLLFLLFLSMAAYYKAIPLNTPPKGIWAILTYFICFVRDHIAKENIGPKHYERFTPYLLSIFWFIWLNNTLGLFPGAGNVTGNISATFVLAAFTFFITNLNGSRDYWKHIFSPPGVPTWLLPMIVPIEILGLFTKTITLMMRLFANIVAGHLVLLSIISIVFILKTIFASIIVVPIGSFMIFMKLGVSFLQAYIFTLLSAISIGSAVETHDETHDHTLTTKPLNP